MWMLLFLFTGSFFAAVISGTVGFGGALLLLPILNMTIGVTMAVPILTVAQLIGNLSRVFFGFKVIKWKPAIIFIFGAVPMSIMGAYYFVIIPKDVITKGMGLMIIIFIALNYFKILSFHPDERTMFIGGAVVGLVSGLVGSAGPLGSALFLSLDLIPASYVSSEAVTSVAMHVAKTMVYQKYLGISLYTLSIGLFMGLAMIPGTWVGRKMIGRMSKENFAHLIGVLITIIGVQMLFFG